MQNAAKRGGKLQNAQKKRGHGARARVRVIHHLYLVAWSNKTGDLYTTNTHTPTSASGEERSKTARLSKFDRTHDQMAKHKLDFN